MLELPPPRKKACFNILIFLEENLEMDVKTPGLKGKVCSVVVLSLDGVPTSWGNVAIPLP